MTERASPRLLRVDAVLDRIGIGRRTFHELVRAGSFPAPVNPTPRTTAWLESEVESWIASKIEARDRKGIDA